MNNKEVGFWRKGEFYLVVLLFIFTMVVVTGAFGFPYLAKVFPLLVGSVGLLLIIMDVLQMLIPKFGVRFRSLKGGEVFTAGKAAEIAMEKETETESEESARPTSILKTLLWFIGAFIGFYLFGYLLFAIVFLFLFLKFYSSLSLIRSLEITGGVSLFLWLSFTLFLKLDIFAGSVLF